MSKLGKKGKKIIPCKQQCPKTAVLHKALLMRLELLANSSGDNHKELVKRRAVAAIIIIIQVKLT